MDAKSLLLQSEDVLPTLEQGMSTAAVAAPALPTITADRSAYIKMAGGAAMGLAGMLYLRYGKKNGDVQQMVIGAVLILGSVLLF